MFPSFVSAPARVLFLFVSAAATPGMLAALGEATWRQPVGWNSVL